MKVGVETEKNSVGKLGRDVKKKGEQQWGRGDTGEGDGKDINRFLAPATIHKDISPS